MNDEIHHLQTLELALRELHSLKMEIKVLAVEKANWQTLALERTAMINVLTDQVVELRKRNKHLQEQVDGKN